MQISVAVLKIRTSFLKIKFWRNITHVLNFFHFPSMWHQKFIFSFFLFHFYSNIKRVWENLLRYCTRMGKKWKRKSIKHEKLKMKMKKMSYWANFSSFLHHLNRAEHKAHIAYIFLLLPCFPFFFGSLFKSRCCWMPLYFLCFLCFYSCLWTPHT